MAGTLRDRTDDSDTAQRAALAGIWGGPQDQHPALFEIEDGKRLTAVAPLRTSIDAGLSLERRQKGLLWYQTYTVSFAGSYEIGGRSRPSRMRIELPYGADNTTFEDVFLEAGGRYVPFDSSSGELEATVDLPPHAPLDVRVGYRSHGLDRWSYSFGGLSEIRNFTLRLSTNTPNVDFLPGTLAPTQEHDGVYTWRYADLVTSRNLGVAFLEPMQPGPLAQRLTMWAPLALGFYFFVLLVIATLRGIDLHPMNYLFLAASFFAFHLLFAYTIDRIAIAPAFALASAVSVALTISYLRLVVGLRFAAVEAGLAQFFYLILFSLALFNEGFSGLSITIGAIVTLFLMQQWTARLNWSAVFHGASKATVRSEPPHLPSTTSTS